MQLDMNRRRSSITSDTWSANMQLSFQLRLYASGPVYHSVLSSSPSNPSYLHANAVSTLRQPPTTRPPHRSGVTTYKRFRSPCQRLYCSPAAVRGAKMLLSSFCLLRINVRPSFTEVALVLRSSSIVNRPSVFTFSHSAPATRRSVRLRSNTSRFPPEKTYLRPVLQPIAVKQDAISHRAIKPSAPAAPVVIAVWWMSVFLPLQASTTDAPPIPQEDGASDWTC
jgi:hypothetical protein